MSKTGTYKWVDGRVVKVSSRTPKLRKFVYYPPRSKRHCGCYFDEHLGDVWVKDKDHKRQLMKDQYLAEVD